MLYVRLVSARTESIENLSKIQLITIVRSIDSTKASTERYVLDKRKVLLKTNVPLCVPRLPSCRDNFIVLRSQIALLQAYQVIFNMP